MVNREFDPMEFFTDIGVTNNYPVCLILYAIMQHNSKVVDILTCPVNQLTI